MATHRRQIQRLARDFARAGHPRPWRWARAIVDGWDARLLKDNDTGWRLVYSRFEFSGDIEWDLDGVIAPDGREFLIRNYRLKAVEPVK